MTESHEPKDIDTGPPNAPVEPLVLWGGLGLAVSLCYFWLGVAVMGTSPAAAVLKTGANVLPLLSLALALNAVIRTQVFGRPLVRQTMLHIGLAVAFSLLWYAAIVLLLRIASLWLGQPQPTGFGPVVMAWQIYQGLAFYAAIAAATYALRPSAATEAQSIPPHSAAAAPMTRYLIRTGEDVTAIEVATIVSILGAEDYAEVVTERGRHLARLSLSAFEARLDPSIFVRVHRSAILNLAHLTRAEPAGGGRLLAHMRDGQSIAVSRSGARALREFTM